MQKSTKIDACRISCFFASSFLVCDGHWSKKLEVKNKLIRRLSNKLLFRIEFSRAHEPDHRVFSCSQARSSSFLVLASQIIEFSRAHGPDRRVFSCSRARSSSFLVVVAPKRVPVRPEAKNPPTLSGVLDPSGKVYLPPYPPSLGPGLARIKKSLKNARFYKVYQPRPSKTSYAKGGVSLVPPGGLEPFG